jgi:hypothetical protein
MDTRKHTRELQTRDVNALPKPASRIRPRSRLGRCYELAGRYVFDDPRWSLVHGTACCADGRVWHAWLKFGDYIYDPVLDRSYSAHEYASTFDTEEDSTFTQREAAVTALKFGHWGPWVDERPRPGDVIVHNHIRHDANTRHGTRGFRYWSEPLSDKLAICHCGWRPKEPPHYQNCKVRRTFQSEVAVARVSARRCDDRRQTKLTGRSHPWLREPTIRTSQ